MMPSLFSAWADRLRGPFAAARGARFRAEWFWVAAGGFGLFCGLMFLIADSLHFDYIPAGDVIGWISINQYPKRQEFYLYKLAFIAAPAAVGAAWVLWLALANELARRLNEPVEKHLTAAALAFLPLLLAVREAYYLRTTPGSLIGWLICPALLCGLYYLARRNFPGLWSASPWNEVRPSRPGLADSGLSAPATVSPASALTRTSLRISAMAEGWKSWNARRSWRLLRPFMIYAAVPAVLYLAMLDFNLMNQNIDLFHEGEFLAPLNEFLRGRVPFRDFYIQHGLFANVTLPYIASRIFGPSLEGWRLFLCLIWPLGYLCIYFLGLQIFRSPVTALLLMPVVHVAGLYRIERFSFGLIGVALIASQIGRRPGWRIAAAGAATVLAFFHSTEIGLYALAAIGAFLLISAALPDGDSSAGTARTLRTRLFPLALYCGGILATLIPFLIYFGARGALPDLIFTIYKQCALQIPIWGLQLPSLIHARQMVDETFPQFLRGDVFRCYLPLAWLVVGEIYLLRGAVTGMKSRSDRKFLLLWLWSAVFFRTALGRSDGPHILRGGMMTWLLWIFFLERAFFFLSHVWRRYRHRVPVPPAATAGRALFILISAIYIFAVRDAWLVPPMDEQGMGSGLKSFYLTADETERYSKTGLFLSAEEAVRAASSEQFLGDQRGHIDDVALYIRKHTAEGEPIFDFSNQGAYYFFANRPSATRYFQIVHAADEGMQREAIADLEKKKPRVVIYQTNGMYDNIDRIPMADRLPLIAGYLVEHYVPAENIRGTILLKLRSEKGEDHDSKRPRIRKKA